MHEKQNVTDMPEINPSIDPLLQKAIEVEKAKIKVESYDDAVLGRSFSLRTTGLLSGAAIGAVAGQIIGSSAGAAAAAAEERERREKGRELEAGIMASPELQEQLHRDYAGQVPEDMSLSRFHEAVEHSRTRRDFVKSLVSWKAMGISALTGAALGAVLGAGDGVTAIEAVSGGTVDKALYSAGVLGSLGAIFGLNYSTLFTMLNQRFERLFSGDAPEGKEQEMALEAQITAELEQKPVVSLDSPLPEHVALGYRHASAARAMAENQPTAYAERLDAEREQEALREEITLH